MLEGLTLRQKYIRYIVPSIAAQVVFTAYTLVDGIFVARGVGEIALAAVNISAPYITLLWALSITFAVGTSTAVARLKGEGNNEEAGRIFTRNIAAMAIVALILSVTITVYKESFADFLGATKDTKPYVVTYLGTIAPFSATFLFSYTFEILMATDGHPSLATIIVSTGVVTNCVLDYVFIFILHKGVFGAAAATVIAQLVIILLYLTHFLSGRATIRFRRFRWDTKKIIRCIGNGIPTGISELSPGLVTFVFVHSIDRFLYEKALISYSAIAYIAQLLVIIAIGIGQGTQPLISYYNGRGEKDKIRTLMQYQFRTAMIIEAFAVVLVMIFAKQIAGIFITSDIGLIEYTANALRIFVIASAVTAINVILALGFTSLEKPAYGITISLGRCTYMLLPAILIAVVLLGGEGLWWGMLIAELFTLVVGILIYKKEVESGQVFGKNN